MLIGKNAACPERQLKKQQPMRQLSGENPTFGRGGQFSSPKADIPLGLLRLDPSSYAPTRKVLNYLARKRHAPTPIKPINTQKVM